MFPATAVPRHPVFAVSREQGEERSVKKVKTGGTIGTPLDVLPGDGSFVGTEFLTGRTPTSWL
jgi:hypothetical protein